MAWQPKRPYGKGGNGAGKTWSKPERKPYIAPTWTPSAYQAAVLDWLVRGEGNAIVRACPGSGKTSTLELLYGPIQGKSVLMLAFNKTIASALVDRGMPGATFHSVGMKALRAAVNARLGVTYIKDWLQDDKCSWLYDAEYGTVDADVRAVKGSVLRVVGLLKNGAVLPSEATNDVIGEIVDRHGIDFETDELEDSECFSMARTVLAKSCDQLEVIDFNDMLYLCHVLNVRTDTYDVVMVDEAQDTNRSRRLLLNRLLGKSGRLLAVGDEGQAIYGFTGADADSMQLIEKEYQCVSLPLTISYRCPRSVVDVANGVIPGSIEAAPLAKEGTVRGVSKWKLEDFDSADLVLCRNTAPLIGLAYRMLARRIGVRVLGRDIGRGLVSLIERLAGKGKDANSLDRLTERVEGYRVAECDKASRLGHDGKVQRVNDQCDSVVMLADSLEEGDRTVKGLVQVIDSLFADGDEKRGVCTLSTIHKAKGMESKRVVILDADLMPSKYARQAWMLVQERNLEYVAVTRSLDTLLYVGSEGIE